MNGDGYPHVSRRRAATIALDRAIGWAGRVTEFLALFFAAGTLAGAVRLALGVEYDPFSLQEAATNVGTIAGTVVAFALLGRLRRPVARALVALAALPAATALGWLAEWWVHGRWAEGLWFDIGRTLILAVVLFPVVYLFAGTIALIGAVVGPDAYLGEGRENQRSRR